MLRRLAELAGLFLKLGTIGFGGPAVHLATIEDETVQRRGWLTREHYLDMMGATNLIPGPNSTEVAMHVGYHRAGFVGLIVAGLGLGWAIAVPAERIGRIAVRAVTALAVALAAPSFESLSGAMLALVLALSPWVAALLFWVSDGAWTLLTGRVAKSA